MKKQIPAVLLAIVCIALALGLIGSRKDNTRLKQQITELMSASEKTVAVAPETEAEQPLVPIRADSFADNQPQEAESASEDDSSGRRMMSSMAKMMENPTMNKVMEASQRGALNALYADLIEYLELNPEEQKYFMDLLMHRQMTQVDLSMKVMGGGISEEEKQTLVEEVEAAVKTVKTEMENFLNNPEDFEEFQFYEKTMGERMMLSQMDQTLTGSDAALSDETYREVLNMMHEEKKDFDYTSDLHDDKNMDLSPERFSKENLQNFSNDMDELNRIIVEQAQNILTADQLKALEEAMRATAAMQKAQMEMAVQMFGGGEKPTTP